MIIPLPSQYLNTYILHTYICNILMTLNNQSINFLLQFPVSTPAAPFHWLYIIPSSFIIKPHRSVGNIITVRAEPFMPFLIECSIAALGKHRWYWMDLYLIKFYDHFNYMATYAYIHTYIVQYLISAFVILPFTVYLQRSQV